MPTLLESKVALVTGAGSGIGREIAYAYAAEGARVVVSDVNDEGGRQTVAEIRKKDGHAVYFRADTSKPCERSGGAGAVAQLRPRLLRDGWVLRRRWRLSGAMMLRRNIA